MGMLRCCIDGRALFVPVTTATYLTSPLAYILNYPASNVFLRHSLFLILEYFKQPDYFENKSSIRNKKWKKLVISKTDPGFDFY